MANCDFPNCPQEVAQGASPSPSPIRTILEDLAYSARQNSLEYANTEEEADEMDGGDIDRAEAALNAYVEERVKEAHMKGSDNLAISLSRWMGMDGGVENALAEYLDAMGAAKHE